MTSALTLRRRGDRRDLGRHALPPLRLLGQLAALIFVVLTVLFILVRVTGDPALILAGEHASQQTLEAIRRQYGLDRSLLHQYLAFWAAALRLDFGTSLLTGQPAIRAVWERLPSTLLLTATGIVANVAIAVPVGAFLGAGKLAFLRRTTALCVSLALGVPGYLVALILIQVCSVELHWFPSTGQQGPMSLVLPSLTIAAFLAPKLIRVIGVNVAESLDQDFCTTAESHGAGHVAVLVRHALPNALLGATALLGTQIATLLNGIVITETIFGWPGVGRLLFDSVLSLDFPVVQAVVMVTTVLVFAANAGSDKLLEYVDPRLRRG